MTDVKEFISKQITTEAESLFHEDLSKAGQLVREAVAAFTICLEAGSIKAAGGSTGVLKLIEKSKPFDHTSNVHATPIPDNMKEQYYTIAMGKLFPRK